MTTAGTWYPPSCGTGGFLSDAIQLSNPPFALMTNTTTLLDWSLQHRHQYQYTQLLDLLDLARMWDEGIVGPDKVIECSQLKTRWGITNNSAKNRILRLRDAGLIAYTCGDRRQPGYRFQRIGPPSMAM